MKSFSSCMAVLLVLLFLIGCQSNTGPRDLDLDYVKKHAKIGLTEEAVKDIFGERYTYQFVDNSHVWMYEDKELPGTTDDLNQVAFEELIRGDLKYQLFIIMKESKAFIYTYFYKGSNGRVWSYDVNPDSPQGKKGIE
jgi:hypothetical protein